MVHNKIDASRRNQVRMTGRCSRHKTTNNGRRKGAHASNAEQAIPPKRMAKQPKRVNAMCTLATVRGRQQPVPHKWKNEEQDASTRSTETRPPQWRQYAVSGMITRDKAEQRTTIVEKETRERENGINKPTENSENKRRTATLYKTS